MAGTRIRLDRRGDRYQARRMLWRESGLERVRACGYRSVVPGGMVGIKLSGTVAGGRSAGFSGLASCGSTWACPVCSAKIAAHRQGELAAAIRAWQAGGGEVVMVTLTMRHDRGQRLKTLWDACSSAWASVTSGRAWQDDKLLYGVAGWTRVVEVTHGAAGWHVHVHSLLFVAAGSTLLPGFSALDLGPTMFQRWRNALLRKGLAAPLASRGGLHVKRLSGDAGGLGDYFTKSVYSADSAAWEVVGGQGKTARRANRTPFQILADVYRDGDAEDLAIWHEWERESSGRRQLTWSLGIRALLGVGVVELSDDQVAEAEMGGDLVLMLDAPTWVAWRWRAEHILEAAECDGPAGVLELLRQ